MAFKNKNGLYDVMSLPETNLDSNFQIGPGPTDQPNLNNAQGSSTTFETMDRQSVAGTNTLKRNPKMELSKTDLLRLLSYMEGELQAQNIVIAALKSERLKHELTYGRYKPSALNAPLAALARDGMLDKSNQTAHTHQEMTHLADQQFTALDNLVVQQRHMQIRMATILKEAEEKHARVIHELEDEKRKHEHDTAQGDDITYGLEMERTRLKQELELEKQAKKKYEKDQKKFQESIEDERCRQKQIVLLLLAERKKIIIRYVEERKRSEDLAQILSEEKSRIDAMAEGLEEESKKSLRSEAELEKHLQHCEKEKIALRAKMSSDEQRIKDLEAELQVYKQMVAANNKANEAVISQNAISMVEATGIPSSVAKVMQPTSTVSSVPVSGPTTGIAQTIHSTHQQPQRAISITPMTSVKSRVQSASAAAGSSPSPNSTPPHLNTSAFASRIQPLISTPLPQTATPAGTFLKKQTVINRGVPPPIPPNKPVVPPKRDAADRKPSIGSIPATPQAARSTPQTGTVQRVVSGAAANTTAANTNESLS